MSLISNQNVQHVNFKLVFVSQPHHTFDLLMATPFNKVSRVSSSSLVNGSRLTATSLLNINTSFLFFMQVKLSFDFTGFKFSV